MPGQAAARISGSRRKCGLSKAPREHDLLKAPRGARRRTSLPPSAGFRRLPNSGQIARRRLLLRWTKWLLPAGALLLLASIAAWPEIQRSLGTARIGLAQASRVRLDSGRMLGARYRGLDGRDRPYMITAEEAQQVSAPAPPASEPAGDARGRGRRRPHQPDPPGRRHAGPGRRLDPHRRPRRDLHAARPGAGRHARRHPVPPGRHHDDQPDGGLRPPARRHRLGCLGACGRPVRGARRAGLRAVAARRAGAVPRPGAAGAERRPHRPAGAGGHPAPGRAAGHSGGA